LHELERMTPLEAEEVLKRFREEEELRQREMEAQATNPTVADLAEGLGVPKERIAGLLAQVRSAAVEPQPFRAAVGAEDVQTELKRANRSAWMIAVSIVAVFFVLAVLAMLLSTTRVEVPAATEQPPPATEERAR
jgi:hypothetical protein